MIKEIEIPRCDLHRHMAGCIRLDTVHEILRRTNKYNIGVNLCNKMILKEKNVGFERFDSCFSIINSLDWHDWAIDLAIYQICSDLAAEKIDYSEISFSIDKYAHFNSWTPAKVIKFIYDSFDKYCDIFNIKVGLLLGLKYNSLKNDQLEYSDIIDDIEIRDMVCGLDLIGNEKFFDSEFYKPIFKKWKLYNKILRAHVGEMPGCGDNVRKAIDLGVSRIAHGIQADEDTIKLAMDQQIHFDLALHSNLMTGACKNLDEHPLRKMMELGCKIALSADDPIQFGCTLDDEFKLAIKHNLITEDQVGILMNNAFESSHIPNHVIP